MKKDLRKLTYLPTNLLTFKGLSLTPTLSHRRGSNAAFTLAEVLITIAVIGIVAVLIIPGIIAEHKKKVTETRLKEAYNIFSQVIMASVQENGPVSGWTIGDSYTQYTAETYFIPYMKGATKIPKTLILKNRLLTLSNYMYHGAADYHGFYNAYLLPNGMSFNLYMYRSAYPLLIVVDINGLTNKPNVLGIDGFVFEVDKKTNTVHPHGYKRTREQLLNPSSDNCSRSMASSYYSGECCAALIEKDGWRITKDYPWGNGGRTK